jgi:hypothetical protein
MMKWILALFLVTAYAPDGLAAVTLPYTFSSGGVVRSAEVNANDGALRDEINSHELDHVAHHTTLEEVLGQNNSCGATNINFNNTQGLAFRAENFSSDPAPGHVGRIIFNTTSNLLKIDNGTAFVSIAGSGAFPNLASVLAGGNTAGANDLDMTGRQLLNARVENLSSNPTPANVGRIFWDTVNSLLKVDDGAAIKTMVDLGSTQTLTGKTISGASNTLSAVPASALTGQVAIGNGGTGQATKAAGFDALSPNTTKGDVTVFNGTTNVRQAVGADGKVLSADSAQTTGLNWISVLSNPMTTLGDIITGGASGAAGRLAGNTTTTKKFLAQTGDGVNSAAPSWATIAAGDVPTLNQNTTGTAANVTGTVAIGNGGTGQTAKTAAFDALSPNSTLGDITYQNGTNNVRLAGNTTSAKQFLTQTGNGSVSAAPAWGALASGDLPTIALTGNVTGSASGGSVATTIAGSAVTNAMHANMANNTVKGNVSGGAAAPSDLSQTQLTALINSFSSTLSGAVPASGGGTTNFLRADGNWAAAGSPLTTKGDLFTYSSAAARLPVGTDGQTLLADSSQTTGLRWSTAASGLKNYVTYSTFENAATTGWSLAHSSLTSTFPSSVATAGTAFDSTHGGSAAAGALSIATVSSGQLAGSNSLSLASSAATTAGDLLISQAYTIDTADQAKALGFKFSYKAQSGASNANWSGTSSNSFGVAIYDVTNAAWIMPAGVWNIVQSSGVGISTGTFQTPSNMTQFQVALFNANATSGAATVYLDDFSVGPQVSVSAPAVTDLGNIAWTPTIAGSTSNPTLGTNTTQYKAGRIGDRLVLQANISQTAAGSAGSGTYLLPIPSGLTIDSAKATISTNGTLASSLGSVNFYASAGTPNAQVQGVVYAYSTTQVAVLLNGANNWGSTYGSLSNATVALSFVVEIPVTGWSSNTASSADTDTRVVATRIPKTSGSQTSNNAWQDVASWDAITFDTTGSFNTSTGVYTVPVSGKYRVYGALGFTANTTGVRGVQVLKNGSAYSVGGFFSASSSQDMALPFSVLVDCAAGDSLKIQGFQSSGGNLAYATGAGTTNLAIERVSGPAVVQATESVNARYNASATSVSSTLATISWTTKDFDSHAAMASGTYTLPVSGKFQVNSCVYVVGGSVSGGNGVTLQLQKNGSLWTRVDQIAQAGFQFGPTCVSDIVSGSAGDTVRIQASTTAGTPSISGNAGETYFSISRVGN